MAGKILCSFFKTLDPDQFLFFRESDDRIDPKTIVEYLDPIQFLMPFTDNQPVLFADLDKSKMLDLVNDVLNFASEQLRTYSSLMTDSVFFEDLDEDLI